jgi:hypothetical protein
MPAKSTLNDAIPGDRAAQLATDLQHQKSRLVIKEVVEEVVNSTDFAKKIKDIQLESLEADPARNKLKEWIESLIEKEQTSDTHKVRLDLSIKAGVETELRERGLRNKTFWIPTIIASVAAIAAVAALFK